MLNDLRYAARTLVRTPGFTLTTVVTLALGIGATTAIFSVVNAVLLAPLPYTAPERLAVSRGSLPDLRDLADTARSFDDVAIWASNLYNLRQDGESRQVLGGTISSNLLPLLGVQPILGHGFLEDDPRSDIVILAYGLWQRQFGGDPSILGRRIELSGTPFTVVGVAPSWFRFPSAEFQLWTRLETTESQVPAQANNRALRIFTAVARLKPGVTLQQAQSEATSVSRRLARTYPATNADVELRVESLFDRLVRDVRPALMLLLGVVALLLLIACANVANLMLARTTVREREMAIRAALGAARGRLVRQLATESLLLASIGGILGLLVAMWGVDLLPAILEARLPRADGIRIDGAVMTFALGTTLLTALLFGIAPALQTRVRPAASLKDSGRGTGSLRGRQLRAAIVVGEIGLAVIVIIAAGLLVRSWAALTARDPGFVPDNLVSFNVQLVTVRDAAARVIVTERLIHRIEGLPGVEAAGAATGFPLVTPQRGTQFELDGRQLTPDESGALFIAATPAYFSALRTPVLRGRAFDETDRAGAQPVALISRVLAERVFPGQDPRGRRIRLVNPEQSNEWRTVVGVVDDVQYRGPAEPALPTIYTPFAQTPFLWLYVMVRANGDPGAVLAPLRTVVASVDPTLTAANVRSMSDVLASSTAEPRFNMLLVSGFALVALLLAAVGIAGVMAYSVAQRTQEIGVRVALGAATDDVVLLVLRDGLLMAGMGIVIGLGGATAATRVMRTLLFGVGERDLVTFAGAAAVLLAVALVACCIPARRALRVDPVVALRAE